MIGKDIYIYIYMTEIIVGQGQYKCTKMPIWRREEETKTY